MRMRTQAAIFESIEKEWSDRMEHDNLPPIRFLDEAAKAAGQKDWSNFLRYSFISSLSGQSIIAHARTLEELAQYKPEPVDPDRIALAGILRLLGFVETPDALERPGDLSGPDSAALAEFKRVKGGVS